MTTTPDSRYPALAVLGKAHDPSGTCLRGYCHTTYDILHALMGPPHLLSGDKTNVEWAFRCNDGTIFTVYDWEESAIPAGRYAWHIGGSSDAALRAFHRFTGLNITPLYNTNYEDSNELPLDNTHRP